MPRSRSSDTLKTRKDMVSITDTDPFILTFEKPTQIYRYLKTRFIASPLFLHRNLSYMRGRCSRNNKQRASFKVTDLLDRKLKENEKDAFEKLSNENLTIGFICFNDQCLNAKSVKVETKLERISHKRRKEGTINQNQIGIGTSIVTVNTDDNGTDQLPAVCVSNTEFSRLGESIQTTYQLTFDIEPLVTPSGMKRDKDTDEPSSKSHCSRKQYHAELPVFDKVGRNLLLNGLYHVTALESHAIRQSRMPCWENLTGEADQHKHIADWAEEVNKYYFAEDDSNPFMTFDKTPKIQLYMEWTTKKIAGNKYIQRPKFISDQHNNNGNGNKENSSTFNIPAAVNGVNGHDSNELDKGIEPALKTFIFQFVVNSSTKQRTEERNDFICPWCSLNCIRIYSLMKHLKLSHARLLFQFVEEGTKGRIDVYVNEMYDGSYSGAPHDVLLGSQRGPTRRNVVTNIMVFRPRRPTFKMCEFLEADDGELDQQRQYISGHNRIYYHSETCIPIMPKELDYDSEGEPDPKWLQRTTKQMIDEFTDVNGGEKELMKLWNLHVMKHVFVGDCQISLACDLFLAEKGQELLEKKLFRNYMVHLNSLFNYGLISPRNMEKNMQKLIVLQREHVGPDALKLEREVNIKHWKTLNKKEEQAKKSEAPSTPSKVEKRVTKGDSKGVKTKTNPKRKLSS